MGENCDFLKKTIFFIVSIKYFPILAAKILLLSDCLKSLKIFFQVIFSVMFKA